MANRDRAPDHRETHASVRDSPAQDKKRIVFNRLYQMSMRRQALGQNSRP